MAIAITEIINGERNAVFHISIVGDAGGDLTDTTLIDPADLGLPASPSIRLDRIWYDLTGFDVRLEFDYLASDTPVWSMSGGQAIDLNFECFGGLSDRSPVLDGTGKLMITTSGLGAGDFGSIVLKVRKS